MSKTFSASNKILVLQKIRENKDILFGAFSERLTKNDKTECWKVVHNLSCSLGLVAPGKDWTYTRDVFWQNTTKSTMKKIDNRKQTGSAGGADCKFNEIDNLVLDIIGRDSAVLSALGLAETWSEHQDPPNVGIELSGFSSGPSSQGAPSPLEAPSSTGTSRAASPSSSRRVSKRRREDTPEERIMSKKERKTDLQIALLERHNHLTNLRILNLERQLGLSHSSYVDYLIGGEIINLAADDAESD